MWLLIDLPDCIDDNSGVTQNAHAHTQSRIRNQDCRDAIQI